MDVRGGVWSLLRHSGGAAELRSVGRAALAVIGVVSLLGSDIKKVRMFVCFDF